MITCCTDDGCCFQWWEWWLLLSVIRFLVVFRCQQEVSPCLVLVPRAYLLRHWRNDSPPPAKSQRRWGESFIYPSSLSSISLSIFIYLQSLSHLYLHHSFFLTLSLFLLRSFSSPPCCSLQNGPPPDVVKTPTKQTEKPQAKSLFSDDEDSQVCFFFFNTHSQVCKNVLNVVGGTSHAYQLHQYLHEPYN